MSEARRSALLEIDPRVTERPFGDPLVALAVGRPVLMMGLCLVGVATIGALAFRMAAPSTVAAALAFPSSIVFLIGLPALVGAATPAPSGLARALLALFLALVVAAAPAIGGFAASASGVGLDPAGFGAGLRIGLVVFGLFLLGGPLARADRAHLAILIAASGIGVAAAFALAELGQIASDRAPGAPNIEFLVLGGVLGLQLSAFLAGRFAEALARGGSDLAAAAEAVRESAPLAAFLAIGASLTFVLNAPSGFGAGLVDAAAAALPSQLAVIAMGGAALALVGGGDAAAVAANARRDAASRQLRRVRGYLSSSACLSAMAVAGVVAIVAALDRPGGPDPAALLGAAIAGGAAAVAFVSLRAGVAVGALLTVIATIIPWAAGPFLPAPTRLETMAAMLLAAGLLAPVTLAWRERRNPWRKAREVWLAAAETSLGATLTAAALTAAGLWAAAAFDVWPEAARVLAWTTAYGLAALLLSPAWLIGFGAAIGRGE